MSGICCNIPSFLRSLRHAGAGLLLLCALCLHAAFANTLSGDVTDPEGHAISGATTDRQHELVAVGPNRVLRIESEGTAAKACRPPAPSPSTCQGDPNLPPARHPS